MESDNLAAAILVDADVDKILLGGDPASAGDARVTCRQSSTTAGLPTLQLDQADDDQAFIKFVGTSASTCGQCILDTTGTGAVNGPKRANSGEYGLNYAGKAVKVLIGTTVYYMPLFTCESPI